MPLRNPRVLVPIHCKNLYRSSTPCLRTGLQSKTHLPWNRTVLREWEQCRCETLVAAAQCIGNLRSRLRSYRSRSWHVHPVGGCGGTLNRPMPAHASVNPKGICGCRRTYGGKLWGNEGKPGVPSKTGAPTTHPPGVSWELYGFWSKRRGGPKESVAERWLIFSWFSSILLGRWRDGLIIKT